MNATEILLKYTNGEIGLEEANDGLKGSGLFLNPDKHMLTADEVMNGTAGLLDTGTGTLDKVHIKDGELVDVDMGGMFALVITGGKKYEVQGKKLIEI